MNRYAEVWWQKEDVTKRVKELFILDITENEAIEIIQGCEEQLKNIMIEKGYLVLDDYILNHFHMDWSEVLERRIANES